MGTIVVLAWGKSVYDRGAGVGCDHVDFGGYPSPGASDSVGASLGEGATPVGMDFGCGAVQP